MTCCSAPREAAACHLRTLPPGLASRRHSGTEKGEVRHLPLKPTAYAPWERLRGLGHRPPCHLPSLPQTTTWARWCATPTRRLGCAGTLPPMPDSGMVKAEVIYSSPATTAALRTFIPLRPLVACSAAVPSHPSAPPPPPPPPPPTHPHTYPCTPPRMPPHSDYDMAEVEHYAEEQAALRRPPSVPDASQVDGEGPGGRGWEGGRESGAAGGWGRVRR